MTESIIRDGKCRVFPNSINKIKKAIFYTAQDGLPFFSISLRLSDNLQNKDLVFKSRTKIYNLTKMFTAGNEPTTIDEFYQRIPVGMDLTAYNAGEIVDGKYGAIKTTALNQWDEQWEKGYYDGSTGLPVNADVIIRSKNYNRILPNTKYFCKSPDYIGYDARIFFYTQAKEFIKAVSFHNTEITTPSDAYYFHLKFGSFSNNATTYNNDICINLSWDEYTSLNGTYQPYMPFVRNLGWISKYFPDGMKQAGNIRDEIRFNSTTHKWEAVQNVGVVDLGSLSWDINKVEQVYMAQANNLASTDNILSELFEAVSRKTTLAAMENRQVKTHSSKPNYLYCKNTAYTDVATFQSAMQGVMLNYELATPIITEIIENVNLDYDCSDYGTEELIPNGESAPLVADIVYQPNALATIKQVPDILERLAALEAQLASLQTATTDINEEIE